MAEIASDELVAEIERGLADVPPGTWETDTERQEDPPYWHDEFVLLDGEGRRLCGTQNCDSHFCEVHVEFGDGPSSYWNEPARLLMEYIARMSPDNIAAILARLRKAERDNANMAKLLQGYHQICSEAGIAPSTSEIYAAAERLTERAEKADALEEAIEYVSTYEPQITDWILERASTQGGGNG